MYLLKTEILKQDIKLITKSEEAGPCKAKAVSQEKFDCCIRKHSLLDTVSQELVTSCKYAMLLLTPSPAGEKCTDGHSQRIKKIYEKNREYY